MRRRLPTILILLVMVLVGAMHWIDLAYYTNPETGFPSQGEVWMRYVVLLLPLVMALFGLRTIGPHGIAALRVRSRPLAGVFAAAAVLGAALGVLLLFFSIRDFSAGGIVMAIFYLWYGVWMFFAALQLLVQNAPSPTKSAALGIFAALPYCILAVYRIMIVPSSLYRITPAIACFAALFAMLWMGLLLRGFYIALTQQRVRWIYFMGVLTFLLCTCLEMPSTIYTALFMEAVSPISLLTSLNLGVLGLCAGCVSVAIAGQSDLIAAGGKLRPSGEL